MQVKQVDRAVIGCQTGEQRLTGISGEGKGVLGLKGLQGDVEPFAEVLRSLVSIQRCRGLVVVERTSGP